METIAATAWRWIPPFSASGAVQMAVDQWLFEQCAHRGHPPVLRFYTWSSPTLSLGKHQRSWPSAWQGLTWAGQPVPLVRRPTGGRAVLHQGDLTYMVVVNEASGSRQQVYRALCEFLIVGLRSLGFDLRFGDAGRGYFQQPNCFALATAADLVLGDGTKLIGSAQAWQRDTVLQHGSIRLYPKTALWTQVFGEEVTGPGQSLPLPGAATVIRALTAAAQNCFHIEFERQPLSSHEWQAITAAPSCTKPFNRVNGRADQQN